MHIFTYGLLKHLAALRMLEIRCRHRCSAHLPGYCRRTLLHSDLTPVALAVPDEHSRIPGLVLSPACAADLKIMDAFECVDKGLYQRSDVVVCTDYGEPLHAQAYVAGPAVGEADIGPEWDEEHFEQIHLRHYLRTTIPGFMAHYRSR